MRISSSVFRLSLSLKIGTKKRGHGIPVVRVVPRAMLVALFKISPKGAIKKSVTSDMEPSMRPNLMSFKSTTHFVTAGHLSLPVGVFDVAV